MDQLRTITFVQLKIETNDQHLEWMNHKTLHNIFRGLSHSFRGISPLKGPNSDTFTLNVPLKVKTNMEEL